MGNFFCDLKNLSLDTKTTLAPFWATLVKIWLLLILSSGRTDLKGELSLQKLFQEKERVENYRQNKQHNSGVILIKHWTDSKLAIRSYMTLASYFTIAPE